MQGHEIRLSVNHSGTACQNVVFSLKHPSGCSIFLRSELGVPSVFLRSLTNCRNLNLSGRSPYLGFP